MPKRTQGAPSINPREALAAIASTSATLTMNVPALTAARSANGGAAAAPAPPLRHGAYLCFRLPADSSATAAAAAAVAARFDLENEFDADRHPADAIAFLRRVSATAADIADEWLRDAEAVVHVASGREAVVTGVCRELATALGDAARLRILRGIVTPTSYTGNAMHEFAYARQLAQRPGGEMPNVFIVPMSKTAEWWAKDWMERHTFFLPRYDENGRMRAEGHALAAAAGIEALMRRTYKHPEPPAPDGAYDFLNYFECADAHVATFDGVCAALRDRARNPEWAFVREGPTWRGRRVRTWQELFA
jgi:hypothetical protein